MVKLNTLPQELVDFICDSCTRENIIALRHTDRQLAKKTQEQFNDAFDSLVVTCSKAGLERLEKFVADPYCSKHFLSKVKKITISTLTPYGLKKLAESRSLSQANGGNNYLQAYAYMRKTLVDSLNALPNLNTVTVTDPPFCSNVDPPVQWNDGSTIPWYVQTPFDPLHSAFTMKQLRNTSQATQANAVSMLLHAMEASEISSPGPQVYGLEAVLSIFYDLKARNTIQST